METTGVSCLRGEKSVDSFVYKVRSSNEGTKCSDNFVAPFGCVGEEEQEPWEIARLDEEDCRMQDHTESSASTISLLSLVHDNEEAEEDPWQLEFGDRGEIAKPSGIHSRMVACGLNKSMVSLLSCSLESTDLLGPFPEPAPFGQSSTRFNTGGGRSLTVPLPPKRTEDIEKQVRNDKGFDNVKNDSRSKSLPRPGAPMPRNRVAARKWQQALGSSDRFLGLSSSTTRKKDILCVSEDTDEPEFFENDNASDTSSQESLLPSAHSTKISTLASRRDATWQQKLGRSDRYLGLSSKMTRKVSLLSTPPCPTKTEFSHGQEVKEVNSRAFSNTVSSRPANKAIPQDRRMLLSKKKTGFSDRYLGLSFSSRRHLKCDDDDRSVRSSGRSSVCSNSPRKTPRKQRLSGCYLGLGFQSRENTKCGNLSKAEMMNKGSKTMTGMNLGLSRSPLKSRAMTITVPAVPDRTSAAFPSETKRLDSPPQRPTRRQTVPVDTLPQRPRRNRSPLHSRSAH